MQVGGGRAVVGIVILLVLGYVFGIMLDIGISYFYVDGMVHDNGNNI